MILSVIDNCYCPLVYHHGSWTPLSSIADALADVSPSSNGAWRAITWSPFLFWCWSTVNSNWLQFYLRSLPGRLSSRVETTTRRRPVQRISCCSVHTRVDRIDCQTTPFAHPLRIIVSLHILPLNFPAIIHYITHRAYLIAYEFVPAAITAFLQ